MLECDLIKCQKAFHTVSDVPATQGCSTDVFDVVIEFKRRFAGLTDKFSSPFLIANVANKRAPTKVNPNFISPMHNTQR
jgi:hypothetical protein